MAKPGKLPLRGTGIPFCCQEVCTLKSAQLGECCTKTGQLPPGERVPDKLSVGNHEEVYEASVSPAWNVKLLLYHSGACAGPSVASTWNVDRGLGQLAHSPLG